MRSTNSSTTPPSRRRAVTQSYQLHEVSSYSKAAAEGFSFPRRIVVKRQTIPGCGRSLRPVDGSRPRSPLLAGRSHHHHRSHRRRRRNDLCAMEVAATSESIPSGRRPSTRDVQDQPFFVGAETSVAPFPRMCNSIRLLRTHDSNPTHQYRRRCETDASTALGDADGR